MITIYTKEFCPNCDDVKEVLKKNNIKFEEKDVEYFKNKAKLIVRGFNELPVISSGDMWFEFDNIENILRKIGIKNGD